MGNALPPFMDLDGEWNDTCARLYQCFERVFKKRPSMRIRGKPLVYDTRIQDGDYEEGFWHVVSRGKIDNRLPDFDRARRITWIEPILNGTAAGVDRWAYKEGDGITKLYFWLQSEDYVIILSEKPKVVALVTAFYVDKPWLKEDLVKRKAAGTPF